MKTLCYVLEKSVECESALRIIKLIIDCQISYNFKTDETTIKCRHSDAVYVERVLSLFVV